MEANENAGNRIGRSIWTVWGYLSGAVARFLRPEVTDQESQSVQKRSEEAEESSEKKDSKSEQKDKCEPEPNLTLPVHGESTNITKDEENEIYLEIGEDQTKYFAKWSSGINHGGTTSNYPNIEKEHDAKKEPESAGAVIQSESHDSGFKEDQTDAKDLLDQTENFEDFNDATEHLLDVPVDLEKNKDATESTSDLKKESLMLNLYTDERAEESKNVVDEIVAGDNSDAMVCDLAQELKGSVQIERADWESEDLVKKYQDGISSIKTAGVVFQSETAGEDAHQGKPMDVMTHAEMEACTCRGFTDLDEKEAKVVELVKKENTGRAGSVKASERPVDGDSKAVKLSKMEKYMEKYPESKEIKVQDGEEPLGQKERLLNISEKHVQNKEMLPESKETVKRSEDKPLLDLKQDASESTPDLATAITMETESVVCELSRELLPESISRGFEDPKTNQSKSQVVPVEHFQRESILLCNAVSSDTLPTHKDAVEVEQDTETFFQSNQTQEAIFDNKTYETSGTQSTEHLDEAERVQVVYASHLTLEPQEHLEITGKDCVQCGDALKAISDTQQTVEDQLGFLIPADFHEKTLNTVEQEILKTNLAKTAFEYVEEITSQILQQMETEINLTPELGLDENKGRLDSLSFNVLVQEPGFVCKTHIDKPNQVLKEVVETEQYLPEDFQNSFGDSNEETTDAENQASSDYVSTNTLVQEEKECYDHETLSVEESPNQVLKEMVESEMNSTQETAQATQHLEDSSEESTDAESPSDCLYVQEEENVLVCNTSSKLRQESKNLTRLSKDEIGNENHVGMHVQEEEKMLICSTQSQVEMPKQVLKELMVAETILHPDFQHVAVCSNVEEQYVKGFPNQDLKEMVESELTSTQETHQETKHLVGDSKEESCVLFQEEETMLTGKTQTLLRQKTKYLTGLADDEIGNAEHVRPSDNISSEILHQEQERMIICETQSQEEMPKKVLKERMVAETILHQDFQHVAVCSNEESCDAENRGSSDFVSINTFVQEEEQSVEGFPNQDFKEMVESEVTSTQETHQETKHLIVGSNEENGDAESQRFSGMSACALVQVEETRMVCNTFIDSPKEIKNLTVLPKDRGSSDSISHEILVHDQEGIGMCKRKSKEEVPQQEFSFGDDQELPDCISAHAVVLQDEIMLVSNTFSSLPQETKSLSESETLLQDQERIPMCQTQSQGEVPKQKCGLEDNQELLDCISTHGVVQEEEKMVQFKTQRHSTKATKPLLELPNKETDNPQKRQFLDCVSACAAVQKEERMLISEKMENTYIFSKEKEAAEIKGSRENLPKCSSLNMEVNSDRNGGNSHACVEKDLLEDINAKVGDVVDEIWKIDENKSNEEYYRTCDGTSKSKLQQEDGELKNPVNVAELGEVEKKRENVSEHELLVDTTACGFLLEEEEMVLDGGELGIEVETRSLQAFGLPLYQSTQIDGSCDWAQKITTTGRREDLREVSKYGVKRPFDQVGLPEVKIEEAFVFHPEALKDSSLDFSMQKSRIAVKSPLIRPPKDPRKLLSKPSAEPREAQPLKMSASAPSTARIAFKLPGLGLQFPVLRKTEFGRKVREGEGEGEEEEAVQTSESEETKEEKTALPKPKWTPQKHPGMGGPLMMAELRSKLRKPLKD